MLKHVKQTQATKARLNEFGKSSTIGALIRSGPNWLFRFARSQNANSAGGVVFQWLNQLVDSKSTSRSARRP